MKSKYTSAVHDMTSHHHHSVCSTKGHLPTYWHLCLAITVHHLTIESHN